jgi:Flp pilus assembly CpaE family ATPase
VLSPPGTHGGVTPVAGRYAKRGSMITLAEAKSALGDVEVLTLCNDYAAAAKSLNMGKPLSETTPRSDLRREIRQMAANLSQAHAKKRQSNPLPTSLHQQQQPTSTGSIRPVTAAPALKW